MRAATAPAPKSGLSFRPVELAQYASEQLRQYALNNEIRRSMGRTGVSWDNAMAESFFSTLKHEYFDRNEWTNSLEMCHNIVWWIETIYNRTRRHSAIGPVPPVQHEKLFTAAPPA